VSLLDEVISAHGGADRWSSVQQLTMNVRVSGPILALRLKSPRTRSFEAVVDTQRFHISLNPFPRRGMRGVCDLQTVRIEANGKDQRPARREALRSTDGRLRRRFAWTDLHVLDFLGYAVWNYAVSPFVFSWAGFACHEGGTWHERDGSVWRALHVRYPPRLPAHSCKQTYYFDERGLLRRLDYTAEVFSHLARAAHYCARHQVFDGLVFPTHRVVFARKRSGHPFRRISLIEGWIDGVTVN
jgi:hypothetical protein